MINKTDFGIIQFDSGLNIWNDNYLIIGVGQKFRIYNLFKEQFTQDIQFQDVIIFYKITNSRTSWQNQFLSAH